MQRSGLRPQLAQILQCVPFPPSALHCPLNDCHPERKSAHYADWSRGIPACSPRLDAVRCPAQTVRALPATALPPRPSPGTPPDPAPSTSAPIAPAPRSTPPAPSPARQNTPHQTHPSAERAPPPISPRSCRRDKDPSAPAPRQAWQSPRDRQSPPVWPATYFPTTPWPLPHARDRASSRPAIVAAPALHFLWLVLWHLAAPRPPSLLFRLRHFPPRPALRSFPHPPAVPHPSE